MDKAEVYPAKCICDAIVWHRLDAKGERARSCAFCEQKASLGPDPAQRISRRRPEAILSQMVDELPKKRRPNKKRRRGYRGIRTIHKGGDNETVHQEGHSEDPGT